LNGKQTKWRTETKTINLEQAKFDPIAAFSSGQAGLSRIYGKRPA
jgi:hypothetical protein